MGKRSGHQNCDIWEKYFFQCGSGKVSALDIFVNSKNMIDLLMVHSDK